MGLIKKIEHNYRSRLLKRDDLRFQREYYKEAVLTYPPRHVTIAITSSCTFRCIFCAYHSNDAKDGGSNVYGLNFNLSLEDFRRMVDMCYEGRVPKIHICGTGEPFMHKDVLSFIDYTVDVYGSVSIQTDFYQTPFEKYNYLDAIVTRGDYISCITTDIFSGDPNIHENIKKGSSYEYVISSMEYISNHSNIKFEVHYIITKHNHRHLDILINELARRRINCHVAIVNLHASGFNDFTSPRSVYKESDISITNALKQAESLGLERGIRVSIPTPVDASNGQCGSFWTRFQTWPVKGIDKSRYAENIIVGGCNAVVRGSLNTLGYVFDYGNIMDLWNNEHFVTIRENLLKGVYPDKECEFCQSYK